MTELKTFTFELNDIRVIDLDGKPMFVARDVALVLGYSNPARSVNDHCKHVEILKTTDSVSLDIPARGLQVIPESDLYRLIMRSDMPEAERFQDWVTEEVLPTIRKTGGTYMTAEHAEKAMMDPDFIIKMATRIKTIQAERDEAIRTKAMVAKGREGTLFSKVGNLTRENKRLLTKYENPEFLATTAIPWLKDLFTSAGTSHLQLLLGQELKEISKAYDLPHHKMSGSRWPITLWHRTAIEILRRRSIGGALRPKLAVYLKN